MPLARGQVEAQELLIEDVVLSRRPSWVQLSDVDPHAEVLHEQREVLDRVGKAHLGVECAVLGLQVVAQIELEALFAREDRAAQFGVAVGQGHARWQSPQQGAEFAVTRSEPDAQQRGLVVSDHHDALTGVGDARALTHAEQARVVLHHPLSVGNAQPAAVSAALEHLDLDVRARLGLSRPEQNAGAREGEIVVDRAQQISRGRGQLSESEAAVRVGAGGALDALLLRVDAERQHLDPAGRPGKCRI